MSPRRLREFAVALISAVVLTAVSRGEEPAARARQPVPATAELTRAESTVQDVYKAEFAKRDDASRAALARKLLRESTDKNNDPATRYVLMRDASDEALAADDVATALAALEAMAAEFADKPSDLRLSFLGKAARRVTDPQGAAAVTEAGLRWIDEAVAADDYEQAMTKLAPLVEPEVSRCRDASLQTRYHDRIKEVRGVHEEFLRAQAAMKALAEKPDDPKANLAVGRYLCFAKGEFKSGIPMLVKSGDPVLASLASRDLAGAGTFDDKLNLGDAWAGYGPKHQDVARGCMIRAQFWYLSAMKGAKGLARARLMKKLSVLPPGPDFTLLTEIWGEKETGEQSGGVSGPSDDLPQTPGLLTGFQYATSPWESRNKIWTIRPIYVTAAGRSFGRFHPKELHEGQGHVIEAKPGYAIGAISVDSGDRVFGMRLRFMRAHGVVLDPDDSYDSPWIGSQGTAKAKDLGGDGRAVVGAHILAGGDFEGIALIQLK
jgi:hypothetical protein